MSSFGIDKGVTIRQPATANFMVDSRDKVLGAFTNPGTLQFVNSQAYQNGFFSRIGVTEFCLEYNIPNIVGTDLSGYQFACDISGTTSGTILRIPNGFYNVAELVDAVASSMNASGLFGTVSVVQNYVNTTNPLRSGQVAIYATAGFRFSAIQPQTNFTVGLISLLGVALGGPFATYKRIGINPNASPGFGFVRYLDFVSNQLTYAQDLKDSNTQPTPYDVLLRWYFSATDGTPLLDKYGYPISYGSEPINERRLFNPPKQIKWDRDLPLGNFTIEVLYQIKAVTDGGASSIVDLINSVSAITGQTKSSLLSYMFTLQLSEN